MKENVNNIDIAVILKELQKLIGAKVVKIYQLGEKEIKIKLHQPGRGAVDLIIEAGRRIHTTKYQRIAPKEPSNFSMFLRKHLNSGKISKIKQIDFDRIVEIGIERGDRNMSLIVELLPRGGNIILVDENREIMMPLKKMHFSSRKIKMKEQYKPPESKINPLEIIKNKEDLKNLIKNSDKSIVRTLASELSLGGLYAEEVCYLGAFEKKKPAKELKEEEIKAIYKILFSLFEQIMAGEKLKSRPCVVIGEEEDGERVRKEIDVLPFELSIYKSKEKKFYSSFNDAVDDFFTKKIMKRMEEKAEAKKKKEVERYERILKKQEEAFDNFQSKEEECLRKAELIYEDYKKIEEILQNSSSKEKHGEKISITLPTTTGISIQIDTVSSLEKNAEKYYEKAKEFRKKREGVMKAIEETKEKIRGEEEKEKEVTIEELIPKKMEKRKKEWYERFRWFKSSDGFFVVGGKDARQNEELVKKYMKGNDFFFHTQAEGGPAVIVKTEGKEVSEDGKREIAQFTASYSNLWKYGFYEGDCYCVKAEQVSKTPPSGEYIKKGAFVIRGKREYFKTKLGLYIGIEKGKKDIIACPSSPSLKENMEVFVELQPGDEKKEEISRKIIQFFKKEEVSVSQEKIMEILPPGKSRVNYSPLKR